MAHSWRNWNDQLRITINQSSRMKAVSPWWYLPYNLGQPNSKHKHPSPVDHLGRLHCWSKGYGISQWFSGTCIAQSQTSFIYRKQRRQTQMRSKTYACLHIRTWDSLLQFNNIIYKNQAQYGSCKAFWNIGSHQDSWVNCCQQVVTWSKLESILKHKQRFIRYVLCMTEGIQDNPAQWCCGQINSLNNWRKCESFSTSGCGICQLFHIN